MRGATGEMSYMKNKRKRTGRSSELLSLSLTLWFTNCSHLNPSTESAGGPESANREKKFLGKCMPAEIVLKSLFHASAEFESD